MNTSRRPRRLRWTYTRADFQVTSLLVVLTALVYPGLVLLPQLLRWAAGDPLRFDGMVTRDGPELPGAAIAPATVSYSSDVVWTIPDATTGQWLGSLMTPVLTTVCIVVAAVFLLRLLARARSGEPFGPDTVKLVRALGLVTMVYAVFTPSLPLLTNLVVAGPASADGSIAGIFDLSALLPFLVGMLLFALAECFRVGVQLREDVEGLV